MLAAIVLYQFVCDPVTNADITLNLAMAIGFQSGSLFLKETDHTVSITKAKSSGL